MEKEIERANKAIEKYYNYLNVEYGDYIPLEIWTNKKRLNLIYEFVEALK